MNKFIYTGVIAFLLLGAALAPQAYAETTTNSAMLEQIKTLMAKIQELQKQLATIRGEVQDVIKDGLAEGMTDDDVKEIQELLASDPTIYPEGKVTGYFGPLTKEAVKRFQARHELNVTGTIDDETKKLMEEYFKERYGGKVPPGLMKAPGIMKKVEARFMERCGEKKAMGPLCKKLRAERGDDNSDDDGSDDSDDDSEDFNVEVSIEDGTTTVSFTFEGDDYEVSVHSTTQGDVLAAIAAELDTTVAELDYDLKDEVKDELEDALEDYEAEFNVEVVIDNGTTTVSFTFEGDDYEVSVHSTRQSDILAAVAKELETTVYKLDRDLKDEIKDALDEALDDLEDEDEDTL